MIRPEPTDPTSLPGLVFCASGDQVDNCYSIRVDSRNGSGNTSGFQIRNGAQPATLLVSSHPTISYNQWYRVKATHNQKTGLIVAVLEDVDGVELSRLSVVNQDRKGGRYGVIGYGKASFDNVIRKLVV